MTVRAAVVGTGADPDEPDREGYAMGYRHAEAYRRIDDCAVVACADVEVANARAFAETFDVGDVYRDHVEMIEAVEPDVVSVCVPPHVHAEVVLSSVETGAVDAIHCEKPMATTWGACEAMARAADENDVQLTINHQRRFGRSFRMAKELLTSGEVGELRRVEFAEKNLFDIGTHLFDLANFYVDQAPAEWVIGQVDYREENRWFGAHNENQGLAQWRYDNGVYGLASTGLGREFVGCFMRLLGSDGVVEVGVDGGPSLRVMRHAGRGWRTIDTGRETVHGPTGAGYVRGAARKVAEVVPGLSSDRFAPRTLHERAIASVVDSLRTGTAPELSASNALAASELIFASWESARRTGRVDLPLDVDDNPLDDMVESGRLL